MFAVPEPLPPNKRRRTASFSLLESNTNSAANNSNVPAAPANVLCPVCHCVIERLLESFRPILPIKYPPRLQWQCSSPIPLASLFALCYTVCCQPLYTVQQSICCETLVISTPAPSLSNRSLAVVFWRTFALAGFIATGSLRGTIPLF